MIWSQGATPARVHLPQLLGKQVVAAGGFVCRLLDGALVPRDKGGQVLTLRHGRVKTWFRPFERVGGMGAARRPVAALRRRGRRPAQPHGEAGSPRPKWPGTKGTAPEDPSTATTEKPKYVAISFKISPEFRRELRQLAADYDLSLVNSCGRV